MKPTFNLIFRSAKLDCDGAGVIACAPECEDRLIIGSDGDGNAVDKRMEFFVGLAHAVPRNFSASAFAAATMNLRCAIRQARQ